MKCLVERILVSRRGQTTRQLPGMVYFIHSRAERTDRELHDGYITRDIRLLDAAS